MAKFIQVCASHNALFALDEEGDVYQYHFNSKTWVKLVATRDPRRRVREAARGLPLVLRLDRLESLPSYPRVGGQGPSGPYLGEPTELR